MSTPLSFFETLLVITMYYLNGHSFIAVENSHFFLIQKYYINKNSIQQHQDDAL